MNQSGIQKTVGAMLLASGATLAIMILVHEAMQSFTSTKFQPVVTAQTGEESGAFAWTDRQRRPSRWTPQTGYPETRPSLSPRQAYSATYGQTGQAGYISDSGYATTSNFVPHGASAHQNHPYQVTNYPAVQHPNLPPANYSLTNYPPANLPPTNYPPTNYPPANLPPANYSQAAPPQIDPIHANPNRGVAPQRATPGYPDSQKLVQAQQPLDEVKLEAVPVDGPAPPIAVPAVEQRSASKLPETSVLTHADVVPASPQQESGDASSVLQTTFETQIQDPSSQRSVSNLTNQVQVGRGVFETKGVVIKNNMFDGDVDETPVEKQAAPPSLPQTTMLPRRHAKPQAEVNARQRIQYGESLARRRSYHASREEFILALLMIANSQGDKSANSVHADRLAQALAALDEINDFAAMRNRDGSDSQFQQTVYSHNTQILNGVDLNSISPRKAIDMYCGFAQSQIEQAIGFSVAGSKSLHALGKLELKADNSDPQQASTSQTRALVFFRSSLSVNPKNALCANDLGVLLFNMGRLDEAEETLKRSLEHAQSRGVWENLASVHSQQAANATTVEQRNSYLRLVQMAEREAQQFEDDPRQRGLADADWATTNDFQDKAAFPDTEVQHASTGAAATSQPGPARVKAVSFLQKVTGWN